MNIDEIFDETIFDEDIYPAQANCDCDSCISVIRERLDDEQPNNEQCPWEEIEEIIYGGKNDYSLSMLKDYLENAFDDHTSSLDKVEISQSKHIFKVGLMLNMMKLAAKREKKPWTKWARENIKIIPRTRQDYERLASIRSIENHLHLKKSMIIEICKTIKPSKDDEDPIGKFLTKFEIYVDKDKPSSWETRLSVGTALALVRIENARIVGVDKQTVQRVIAKGISITPTMIIKLIKAQESRLQPNECLHDLLCDKDPFKRLNALCDNTVPLKTQNTCGLYRSKDSRWRRSARLLRMTQRLKTANGL